MHPIEHLRYIARARGLDDQTLVRETVAAIGALPTDRSMLVVVCRRLVEKHPLAAPLWWLCSTVLIADDPAGAGYAAYETYRVDRPYRQLEAAVAAGTLVSVEGWSAAVDQLTGRGDIELVGRHPQADIIVIEAVAATTDRVLVRPEAAALLEAAAAAEVWLVVPHGTRVQRPVVDRIEVAAGELLATIEIDRVTAVLDAQGIHQRQQTRLDKLLGPDGPLAPELLGGLGATDRSKASKYR